MTYGLNLPEYPWEALAPYRATAAAHPDGPVDLSIGTPVDPTRPPTRTARWTCPSAPRLTRPRRTFARRWRLPLTLPATRPPTAPPPCVRLLLSGLRAAAV